MRFNLVSGSGQQVDVMFLADATGSMGPAIANVQSNIIAAWNAFSTASGWDIQLGVAFYRDTADPVLFQVLQTITGNANLITTAANALAATGGGDSPEGQMYALTEIGTLATTGWRPGSVRIVAWFGDQPGHDPLVYNGVSYTQVGAIAALQERNVQVCAFSMNTGTGGNKLDQTGQATGITMACDGSVELMLNVATDGVVTTIFNYIQGEI